MQGREVIQVSYKTTTTIPSSVRCGSPVRSRVFFKTSSAHILFSMPGCIRVCALSFSDGFHKRAFCIQKSFPKAATRTNHCFFTSRLSSLGEARIVNAGLFHGEFSILNTFRHLEEAEDVFASTSTLSLFTGEPARSAARFQKMLVWVFTASFGGQFKAIARPVRAAFRHDHRLRSLIVFS